MAEDNSARAEHHDVRFEERHAEYGDLAALTVDQLQERAAERGIEGRSEMDKNELIEALQRS